MNHPFFALALFASAASALTGCGSDKIVGCDSDDQCRNGRICNLSTNACIDTGDPGVAPQPGRITINDVQDPPPEVSGAATVPAEMFFGTWMLLANGSSKSDDAGTTTFQYDEPWTVIISEGDEHDLFLEFSVSTAAGLQGCTADGDRSGQGFVFLGGPCRDNGNEIETFSGAGFFDQFDELTINVSGDADQLATGYVYHFEFTTSGTPDPQP